MCTSPSTSTEVLIATFALWHQIFIRYSRDLVSDTFIMVNHWFMLDDMYIIIIRSSSASYLIMKFSHYHRH